MAAWLLMAYAIVAPLSFPLPIGIGDARPIDLLGCLVLMALPIFLSQRRRLYETSFLLPILIYIIFTFPSLFMIIKSPYFVKESLRYFRFICIMAPMFLIPFIPHDDALLKRFVSIFIFSGFISITVGVVGFSLGWEFTSAGQRFVYEDGYLARAGGLFQNTGPYGNLIALWAGVSIWTALTMWSSRTRVFAVCIIIIVSVVALAASMSRAGFVGVIWTTILLPIFVYRQGDNKLTRLLILACTAVAIALSAPLILHFDLGRSLVSYVSHTVEAISIGQYDVGTSERTVVWQQSWLLFLDNSVFGIGFKALTDVYSIPADNMLLQALSETGLLGGVGMLVFITVVILKLFARWMEGSTHALALLIIWLGEMLQAVASDVFFYFGSMPVLLAITALVVRHQYPKSQTKLNKLRAH